MALFCSSQEFEELCRGLAGKADMIRLQAKGGSMFPFIRSGDWVNIAPFKKDEENVSRGDIILFKNGNNLYMHRVIWNDRESFIAKGDVSYGHDGSLPIDNIMARVISVERNGQVIGLYSKTNRFISVIAANLSLSIQRPVLAARKICSLGMVLLGVAQRLKIYRIIIKKIVKVDVIVRDAGSRDEEELKDLYLMAGQDIRDGIAKINGEGYWLAAEMKGKIVGGLTVARYEKDPGLWVIFGLEVKPLFRGIGIGEKLVRDAVLKAKENGAREIGLFMNKNNAPALKLYQKAGFKIEDNFPSEFNKADEEFYLSLR